MIGLPLIPCTMPPVLSNNLLSVTPANDGAWVFKGKFYQKENEYADIVTDTYTMSMDIKSYVDSLYEKSSKRKEPYISPFPS